MVVVVVVVLPIPATESVSLLPLVWVVSKISLVISRSPAFVLLLFLLGGHNPKPRPRLLQFIKFS
jgi:hypothetical protein